jgi:predicted nucleic acid-binding protein
VSPDAAEWAAGIERGLVRIATVTRLEVGHPAIEDRSVEVVALLADRGKHRAPSVPNLIIAATTELAGLTVLHLDKDFQIIADITGQPLEQLRLP